MKSDQGESLDFEDATDSREAQALIAPRENPFSSFRRDGWCFSGMDPFKLLQIRVTQEKRSVFQTKTIQAHDTEYFAIMTDGAKTPSDSLCGCQACRTNLLHWRRG